MSKEETLEETNMDKFLKLVSDEKSTWIEDLEHYNKNKEELDTNFEAELNDLITAQETLEEAAGKYENKDQHKRSKLDFIEGAKWQQERMYSEEDLKYAFEQGKLHSNICYSRTFENVLEIIKFKKK